MTRITLAVQGRQLEELRTAYAVLEGNCVALRKQLADAVAKVEEVTRAPAREETPVRVPAKGGVYEFNPDIKGDWARAAALAKANCGRVTRMRVQ